MDLPAKPSSPGMTTDLAPLNPLFFALAGLSALFYSLWLGCVLVARLYRSPLWNALTALMTVVLVHAAVQVAVEAAHDECTVAGLISAELYFVTLATVLGVFLSLQVLLAALAYHRHGQASSRSPGAWLALGAGPLVAAAAALFPAVSIATDHQATPTPGNCVVDEAAAVYYYTISSLCAVAHAALLFAAAVVAALGAPRDKRAEARWARRRAAATLALGAMAATAWAAVDTAAMSQALAARLTVLMADARRSPRPFNWAYYALRAGSGFFVLGALLLVFLPARLSGAAPGRRGPRRPGQ